MHVDRGRFLHLVAALAGATAAVPACAREPEPQIPALTAELPPPPPPAAAPTPIASGRSSKVTRPDDPLGGPALEGPQGPIAPAAEGSIDVFDPAGRHTCSELRCPPGHPFAEGMRVLQHDCRGLEQSLTREAFQRFIQCMLRRNNTRATCDLLLVSADPGGCLERWSEPRALDPGAAAACAPLVRSCAARARTTKPSPRAGRTGALTAVACEGLLSVTRPSARPTMIACITEYCDEAPGLCYISLSH